MFRQTSVFSCALWLLLISSGLALRAEEPRLAPRQGMLLLRNGHALSGKISRTGNRYTVWLPDGEIRLTADQVDLVCNDLLDGYQQKRKRISGDVGAADAHLDLAEWCLQQKLTGPAFREIEAARAADPNHPRLLLVQRRYELCLSQPAPKPVSATVPSVVSDDNLEEMFHELPAGSVETFHQKIQPLLLNSCTAAGCHSIHGNNDFRLSRGAVRALPNRRTTLRNLRAVMDYLDPEATAEKSKLLEAVSTPHGRAKDAVFQKSSWQYVELVKWAASLHPKKAAERPLVINLETHQAAPPVDAPPSADDTAPAAQNAGEKAVQWVIRPRPSVPEPGHLPEGETPASRMLKGYPNIHTQPHRSEPNRGGAQEPEFRPADPFDPAIFNRRFFPAS